MAAGGTGGRADDVRVRPGGAEHVRAGAGRAVRGRAGPARPGGSAGGLSTATTGCDRWTPRDVGRREALAGELRVFAPSQVLSAPFDRCRDTVAPLAESAGPRRSTPSRCSARTPTGTTRPAPGDVWSSWRGAQPDGGTVVACSQGGVIPGVVKSLAGRSDVPIGQVSTPKARLLVPVLRRSTAGAGGPVSGAGGLSQPAPQNRPSARTGFGALACGASAGWRPTSAGGLRWRRRRPALAPSAAAAARLRGGGRGAPWPRCLGAAAAAVFAAADVAAPGCGLRGSPPPSRSLGGRRPASRPLPGPGSRPSWRGGCRAAPGSCVLAAAAGAVAFAAAAAARALVGVAGRLRQLHRAGDDVLEVLARDGTRARWSS